MSSPLLKRAAAVLLVLSLLMTASPLISQDARAEPTTIMTTSFTDGALGPFSYGQNQRQVSSAYYHSAMYSMEIKGGSTIGQGAAAALLEGTNRELTIEFWAMFRGAFTQNVVPSVVTWLGEEDWQSRSLSLLLLNGNSNGTAWIMLPNQAGEVYNDNGGIIATNTLISLNTWYHFSFVLAADRTSLALSLDYGLIGSCPLSPPDGSQDAMYDIGSIAYYQDSLSGDKSMYVDDVSVTADGDPYDPPRWAPSLIAADTPLWVELGQEYSFSLEYNETVSVRLDWVALDAFVGGLTEPERDAYYALYDALTWTNWIEDATTVSSHALIESELITTIPFWMVATSTAGTGQIYTNWTVTIGEEPGPGWETVDAWGLNITSVTIMADFDYVPSMVYAGDPVVFTDTSVGDIITSWHWDFGDGTISNERNPVHFFESSGSFSVTLTVRGQYGFIWLTATHTEIITVWFSGRPIVDFTADNTSQIGAPMETQFRFTGISGFGSIAYFWDFGDGTTSNERDPMHIYEHTGRYDVSLTVVNENGSASRIKYDYIVINQPLFPDWSPAESLAVVLLAASAAFIVAMAVMLRRRR